MAGIGRIERMMIERDRGMIRYKTVSKLSGIEYEKLRDIDFLVKKGFDEESIKEIKKLLIFFDPYMNNEVYSQDLYKVIGGGNVLIYTDRDNKHFVRFRHPATLPPPPTGKDFATREELEEIKADIKKLIISVDYLYEHFGGNDNKKDDIGRTKGWWIGSPNIMNK
jgi:hypothetical protein